jgi:hypothetical protein
VAPTVPVWIDRADHQLSPQVARSLTVGKQSPQLLSVVCNGRRTQIGNHHDPHRLAVGYSYFLFAFPQRCKYSTTRELNAQELSVLKNEA